MSVFEKSYDIPGASLAIHAKFRKNRPWNKGGVGEQTNIAQIIV
jgi:hypothetical protein